MKKHDTKLTTGEEMTILESDNLECLELASRLYEAKRFDVEVCCGVNVRENASECD